MISVTSCADTEAPREDVAPLRKRLRRAQPSDAFVLRVELVAGLSSESRKSVLPRTNLGIPVIVRLWWSDGTCLESPVNHYVSGYSRDLLTLSASEKYCLKVENITFSTLGHCNQV